MTHCAVVLSDWTRLVRAPDLICSEHDETSRADVVCLCACCSGDIETGVDHLSNAVAVCGQPQQLLQVLQQTLPPQVFQMLLMKLPVAGQVSHCTSLSVYCHDLVQVNCQT